MRISTVWMQQRSINEILDRQSAMSDTQLQLSSGKRMLNASDDPVAASQVLNLDHVEAANQQYMRNADSASNRLSLEESSLTQFGNLLQRVHTLALEGANGSQTPDDRAAVAKELRQIYSQMVQVGNAKDAQGDALFAGNAAKTVPFVQGAGFSVSYQGDDGQRMVAAAPSIQVATGDPGSGIFMNVPAGNGRFAVDVDAANTGSVVVGASSVTDSGAYAAADYDVVFTAADTWEARDGGGNVVASGSYDGSGAVAFGGMQVQLDGDAATGDTLHIRAGASQDIFSTVGNLIDAFEQPDSGAAFNNQVNRQLESVDQSIQRVLETRAKVGARLNTLDQQKDAGGDLSVLNKGAISKLQDVDTASAISQLNLQSVALQAAQQTYVKIQGMTLFDYLR